MSAAIRIKIMGGTNIKTAYYDYEKVSISLGGISVNTSFNGVEMFYCRQTLSEWEGEYKKRIYGLSLEKGDGK